MCSNVTWVVSGPASRIGERRIGRRRSVIYSFVSKLEESTYCLVALETQENIDMYRRVNCNEQSVARLNPSRLSCHKPASCENRPQGHNQHLPKVEFMYADTADATIGYRWRYPHDCVSVRSRLKPGEAIKSRIHRDGLHSAGTSYDSD